MNSGAPMPISKKESLSQNKFSYNFQPALIPILQPQSKHKSVNLGLGLGFLPLPKPSSLLKKP
jgi:hypothetical protein